MRPSLRVPQGGRGSIGLPQESPMAKAVDCLGRRALPPASEVKGRLVLEEGWHLSMQQLRPGKGLEADGREQVSGISR